MEQKLVQKKKEAGEVTGSATFENGHLKVPVLENNKITEEVKELLNKKDKKEIINKKSEQNKEKSQKVKPKKADPSFRDVFANKAVEQIKGLKRKDIEDKVLLKYGKNTITRLMVRTNSRFCAYRKGLNNERLTLRVVDDATEQKLLDWISERVEYLKTNAPKPKEQKKAKSKSR